MDNWKIRKLYRCNRLIPMNMYIWVYQGSKGCQSRSFSPSSLLQVKLLNHLVFVQWLVALHLRMILCEENNLDDLPGATEKLWWGKEQLEGRGHWPESQINHPVNSSSTFARMPRLTTASRALQHPLQPILREYSSFPHNLFHNNFILTDGHCPLACPPT